MADRLVIEIDGDASGLTKALNQAQVRLGTFDNRLKESSKSLISLVKDISKTATTLTKLATGAATAKAELNSLARTTRTTATALGRLDAKARESASSLRGFNSALNAAAGRVTRFATSTTNAGATMTSLNRRMAALMATVSGLNGALRSIVRTANAAGGGMNNAGAGAGRAAGGINAASAAAGRASSQFQRLHRASLSVGEGFRRTVAQITALRTITYQALFWFAPLIYSIVKVNSQYERQMVLLRNLSGETNELARQQYALQTRAQLVKFANTNPFSLDQITDSFVKLKVAGLDPVNGSMQTLMDSIAAFGGNDEALQRASVAIQQMAGKGVISMEELRQQLGEHVPDAIQAMATGIGVSVGKLYDQIKEGNVEATHALTQMFEVLHLKHRGSAQQMMNTWSGLLARMQTTWQNFVAKLTADAGKNSFVAKLKEQVEGLMAFLNSAEGVNFAIQMQNALATIVQGFAALIKLVFEWRKQIVAAAQIFALMWGGKLVFGLAMRLVGVFGLVGRSINSLILLFIRMRTGMSLTSAIATTLGLRIRNVARALGMTNVAGQSAVTTLGMVAGRMAAIIGVATAAAAAIYLVVEALNRQTQAQISANMAEKGRAGAVFEDEADALAKKRNLEMLNRRVVEGGVRQYNERTGQYTIVKDSLKVHNQLVKDLNVGLKGYREILGNTNRLIANQARSHYGEKLSDAFEKKMSELDANYNLRISKLPKDDSKGRTALTKEQGEQHVKMLSTEITRLDKMRNQKGIDPALKEAINERMATLGQELNQDAPGADSIGTGFKLATDEDKKKKKKGAGDKRDPLDRYRTKFETEFNQSAELQNEYMNMVNGTDTVFDQEAAQAEAEKIAAQVKDESSLKALIVAEQEKQRELKKSIQVQKAIIELQDDTADSTAKTAQGFEDLRLGYASIEMASKHYKEELQREHREELAIVEARMASGNATSDQIRQYKELTRAINEAVHAKEAEYLLELSQTAKQKNDEYKATFRTDREQQNYEAGIEIMQYAEALNLAENMIIKKGEEIAKINDAIAEAVAKRAEMSANASQEEKEAQDVVVTALRKSAEAEDKNLQNILESIPYLKERIQILREEEAIRNKMGGFAKPLYDWAKDADKGMRAIKESMGQVVTDGLDGLINGLIEGKMAFGQFVKSILKGLLAIILRAIIAKAILSALGMGGPMGGGGSMQVDTLGMSLNGLGATGTVSYGGGHGGMIAGGTPRFNRSISPAAFNFAERYHTGGIVGLRPNEVPIIAEKGEGVFTEEQMKAMGSNDSKGSNVQVNVINQTGVNADVQREQPKFDGEKWVETIILKKVSQPGPLRDILTAKR